MSSPSGERASPSDRDLTPEQEEELILESVRRLSGTVLGLVLGLTCGLGLFAATLFLVIKGGSPVGPHLGLLGQFLIGYSVTVPGSFIGLAYGLAIGFGVGWLIAWIYNYIVGLRLAKNSYS